MTNVYDLNWPVNYQQQVELTRRLENKISEVSARRRNIVIRAQFQPTQSEWENAWVEQTSQPLPIPPGVRLCWYNMTMGYVETYTTAYDQQSGLQSSGSVYEYADNSFDRPPFRLLGTFDSDRGYSGNFSNPLGVAVRTVHMPWNVANYATPWNAYTLARYGLLNLLLVYRLKYDTTNNALRFFLNLGHNNNFAWWPFDNAAKEADQVNVEVVSGASTPTSLQATGAGTEINGARFLGGRPANNNSPSAGYSHGILFANNLVVETKDGAPHREYSGFSGWHITSRVDALTAGNFGFNAGSWLKMDAWGPPSKQNFLSIKPESNERILGKAWLYGFFTQNTQGLREDDRL